MNDELALCQAELAWLRVALSQARWLLETTPMLMPARANDAWLAERDRFLSETVNVVEAKG